MKKRLILLCAVSLLLSGCAVHATANSTEMEEPVEPVETLGALAGDSIYASAFDENHYVCIFERGGSVLRAVANLTPEIYDALRAHTADAATLVPAWIDNLSAAMPTPDELDALVGKSGGELLNDGWEIVGHTIYDDFDSATVFYMNHGLYAYTVRFAEPVTLEGDQREADAIWDLTVVSVTCDGISDHCLDLRYAVS
ncbi:MAG: hypothetical protein IKN81_08190 [Oscillospiraceae bacterium]|nr:hypothetical protein [Oscillospiraceae bacterium]